MLTYVGLFNNFVILCMFKVEKPLTKDDLGDEIYINEEISVKDNMVKLLWHLMPDIILRVMVLISCKCRS